MGTSDEVTMERIARHGGPAFPFEVQERSALGFAAGSTIYPGMTMRQWYAGQAMIGLLAASSSASSEGAYYQVDTIVKRSFQLADAMIAAEVGR